jgi:L-ascorbate metabolism protein UlaG (beta-lactamase superfamily)
MKLTWIDLNSWIFQIAGQTVLVDPWLVDPVVLYGQPWLFSARHKIPPAFTPETLPPVDLILISQGLDDHCHRPTLEKLDRRIPVVASPTAGKIAKQLGYEQVTSLAVGKTIDLVGRLQITAVPGAEIQPGQVENGYVLQDLKTSERLYYEPHLFPLAKADQIGPVDVAIAPVIGQIFPLLGQVIMGPTEALAMVQALHPRYFLPTTRGDIEASGILPALTRSVGSVEEFRDLLANSGLSTRLLVPDPGISLELEGAIQS